MKINQVSEAINEVIESARIAWDDPDTVELLIISNSVFQNMRRVSPIALSLEKLAIAAIDNACIEYPAELMQAINELQSLLGDKWGVITMLKWGVRDCYDITSYDDAHRFKRRTYEYLKKYFSNWWTKKRFRVREYIRKDK